MAFNQMNNPHQNITEICGKPGDTIWNLPFAAKGKASMQLRENFRVHSSPNGLQPGIERNLSTTF